MERLLRKAGYNVSGISGIKQLKTYLDSEEPDLLIMDSDFMKEETADVFHLIREADQKILLMAKMNRKDRRKKIELLEAGVDECVEPDADAEEFILIIKAVLRRAGRDADMILQAGRFQLNVRSLTVTHEQVTETLPRKEFLLLYKLLSHPGSIFTRDQLLTEIWGPGTEASQATLNVHINRLRKRFEDCPDLKIKAVRGTGYRAELQA